ncbi:rhodanese-related sulfurtransferase [Friedmanniella endophytica]|uniref:Rhodanese-related sulfurtransferase n=1 Tax=Microlunatus kandeliicorticis TaxID=1759536 RepID=A0A7W3P5K1_9ACTN|nr:rhodanese-like domain-containing protein [Microlunatus kandeliicorticis]MBA8794069.1 rhodanese-related sulfurtransferase [Microlunatus kandeliicorticis]
MIKRLRATFSAPITIAPLDAHAAVSGNGAAPLLLDVREADEWQAGHAPSALHIPLGQLENRLGEIPADRPVITVCRSGRRSALAARQLAAHGRSVSNLDGGMAAWSAAGLPVVTASGPGTVL